MNIEHLYKILVDKLSSWLEAIVAYLPNFVLAIIVIVLVGIVAGYIRRIVQTLIGRVSTNISLVSLTALIASRLVILIGLFIALGILGLDKTVSSLLAGAGIIGLALGFAFQDLTANFLSGIFITVGQPIRVGDVIETNGFTGLVKEIKIRSTILDNFSGQEIEIPSRRIFENPITNHSKIGGNRIQVSWKVSSKNDLDKVEHYAVEAVKALSIHDPKRPLEFNYSGFDGGSINFSIGIWIVIGNQYAPGSPKAVSEVIKAIKKTFEENEIVVPWKEFEQPDAFL